MSETGERCSYPRVPGAPACTQHEDHTGKCDWWDEFAVPVIEQARARVAGKVVSETGQASPRLDADGSTWVWCECSNPRTTLWGTGPGWAYAREGVTPWELHAHLPEAEIEW